jgi:hypothetical protein
MRAVLEGGKPTRLSLVRAILHAILYTIIYAIVYAIPYAILPYSMPCITLQEHRQPRLLDPQNHNSFLVDRLLLLALPLA